MRFILPALAALMPALAAAGKVDFNSQIQPILPENCYACHGSDEATVEAELRLDI